VAENIGGSNFGGSVDIPPSCSTYITEPPTTIRELKQRIRVAFRNIGQQTIDKTINNFHDRMKLCHLEMGDHMEQLIKLERK
jgi:hypothetical protein